MQHDVATHPDQMIAEVEIGGHILDDVHAYLARFIAYPSKEAHVAHTLWPVPGSS